MFATVTRTSDPPNTDDLAAMLPHGGLIFVDPRSREHAVVAITPSLSAEPRHAADDAMVQVFNVAQHVGGLRGTTARVITAAVRPGSMDAVIGLFYNVVMHAATAQQGFQGGLLLVDREQNRAMSIGLWESMTALRASEQVGYLSQQIDHFTRHLAGPPSLTNAQVLVAVPIPVPG